MGLIYVPGHQRDALKAISPDVLSDAIDEAILYQRADGLWGLHLSLCGPFVDGRFRRFVNDLGEYAKAKSTQKRADTRERAVSSGYELLDAVRDMRHRIDEEEQERQLFRIDDVVQPPYRFFGNSIRVRVSFEWRQTMDGEWNFGSIEFTHDVDLRPDYLAPAPKRKPSAAKVEEDRQRLLYREWEHLSQLALHSLREYLKSGRDRSAIPKTFQAKADGYTRRLNNFSCDFWR